MTMLLLISLGTICCDGRAHTECLPDKCDYPEGLKIVHMFYMLTLIILFSNFYVKSYTKKKTKQVSSPLLSERRGPDSDVDKKHQ